MFSSTDASSPGASLCSLYGRVERLAQLGPALCECAAHVEAGSIEKASRCLARITGMAGASNDGPLQRLAVTMADCLARRLLRPIPGIADALIDPSNYLDRQSVRAARRGFFDLSPFPKVAFVVANRAILEAMENEKNVHVIDLSGPAAQPCQWVQLLHDFHRRPEGPPHLRLTVVHDDKDFLAKMSELLSEEAEELDMPFQFHGVVSQLEAMDFNNLHAILEIKSGEARAISCTLQLHRLLAADGAVYNFGTAHFDQMVSIARLQQMASSSCPPSIEDDPYQSPATPLTFVSPPASTPHFQMPQALLSFLFAVRALSPKIMVLTEQDANHNGFSFRKRFNEALHHYAEVYDMLEAAAAAYRRPVDERAQVERVVLGEEIKDVLLREGLHRRERHDRLHQWALRMELAGFGNVPLSYIAIRQGNDMLRRCALKRCKNKEYSGCLLLCWNSRPLYSVSAWRPSRVSEASGSSEYMSVPSQMTTPVHSFDGLTMMP